MHTHTHTHTHNNNNRASLLQVHVEVSLDGSLGDEGAAHAGQGLPAGEHSRSVQLLRGNPSSLLDQLAEHLRGELRRLSLTVLWNVYQNQERAAAILSMGLSYMYCNNISSLFWQEIKGHIHKRKPLLDVLYKFMV